MKTPVIVNTCPYVPIDNNDEKSAFATLLLHTPWSIEGENMLLHPEESAVKKLRTIIDSNKLPTYVLPMHQKQQISSCYSTNNSSDAHVEMPEAEDNDDSDYHTTNIDYSQLVEEQNEENNQQQCGGTDGVFGHISAARDSYYRNFIQRAQDDFMTTQSKEHQLDATCNNKNNTLFGLFTLCVYLSMESGFFTNSRCREAFLQFNNLTKC